MTRRRPRDTSLLDHLARPPTLIFAGLTILALLVISTKPPPPLGPDAPRDEFSAAQALEILEVLLAEAQPHVSGSAQNQQIRDRITSMLRAWGYRPEIQARFHCHPAFGSCAPVENIIAVKPGRPDSGAILVTAHYDSSWAGPGASDDGVGTAAVLEIARMAAQLGEPGHEIIFLLSDGEELGLIGAHAFAEHHALFDRVGLVINLEARGVTGRSSMFETGEGNRSLIRILSKSLERPAANSLAYEVYKRMPNDTDYSVYKARGVSGFNFAFTDGVALYHSRLDDVGHVDAASLQHQGQNAWSLVRGLEGREVGRLRSREDAAYIDIFGRVLWHYPVSIASGLALVLSVLVVLAISMLRKRDTSIGGVFIALVAQLGVITILVASAWLASWPLGRWVDSHPIEHPNPWLARLVLLLLCALSVWVVRRLLAHRIEFGSATLACWLTFAGLALLLGFQLPAASFLALIPMAAFLVGLVLDLVRRDRASRLVFATLFGFAAAAYLALYHFLMLDVVVPFDLAAFKAAPLVLMLLPMLPVVFGGVSEPLEGWRPAWVVSAAVFLVSVGHMLVPGFTEERPRGMNLVYRHEAESANAWVYIETAGNRPDAGFVRAHDFEPRDFPPRFASASVNPLAHRSGVSRFAVEQAPLMLESTRLEGWRNDSAEGLDDRNTLRFQVVAPAGAERVVLALPHDVAIARATVAGVLALSPGEPGKQRSRPGMISITSPGTAPLDVEIITSTAFTGDVAVTTRHAFPRGIEGAFSADWPADAQPVHSGSRAEIVKEFRLPGDAP